MATSAPASSAAPAFTGFTPEAIQFLADLAENNDRAWFQPRKADFERLLKEPLEALCSELAERFRARGLPLHADPARSPFRIYRDVRFAKDKSPYKTNIGANFPFVEEDAASVERRGVSGYFHFSPGEIFVGGGMWHPEPARLAAFRQAVVADPAGVRAMFDDGAFVTQFGDPSREGHSLTRVPKGFPADHPEAELLKLKDVVFGRRLDDREAFSPRLVDLVVEALEAGVPVMRFLARLA
jgi:uncharacterized protein (TIGR02453 family)